MNYEGTIIRPPNEADSLIMQVTVGCSHNLCTFCPAYIEKKFRIKTIDEIFADIDTATAEALFDVRRIFLCDGDPLIMKQDSLIEILDYLSLKFPKLIRVGIYANAKSILRKSEDELRQLRDKKLSNVYMGLESGDQQTLDQVKKGVTIEKMIEAAGRVRNAGMKLNVTVLLGLGGKERSVVHAEETINVLNRMQPNHVGALTLMIVPGTALYDLQSKGRFELPGKFELVNELKIMIEGSNLKNCLFFSNHASNYFPIKARLPRDKENILAELKSVISSDDERILRDEFTRGL
jgi:radical SAM superfamily enzyme YgiQ (UPF0313 family)